MIGFRSGARMLCFHAVICLVAAMVAEGAFLLPSDGSLPFQWTRPTNDGTASATSTTYQQWDVFTSISGPNPPDVGEINPNGVADAYNSTGTGFITTDNNIYSPGLVIEPRAVVPGYNLATSSVDVLLQVRARGQDIDTADVSVGGVLLSTLDNYDYRELFRTADPNPNGGFIVDHLWTFTVPSDAALFQIDWGWGVISSSLDRLAIDTQSVSAPSLPGDFDDDDDVDASDINILADIIFRGGSDPGSNDSADLNGVGGVTQDDLDYMVNTVLETVYGDADLDDDVDGADFDAWRVRDSLGGGIGWATGDWDGDNDVDGADFDHWRLRLPAIGGAASAAAVPEPATWVMAGIGAVAGLFVRKRGKMPRL